MSNRSPICLRLQVARKISAMREAAIKSYLKMNTLVGQFQPNYTLLADMSPFLHSFSLSCRMHAVLDAHTECRELINFIALLDTTLPTEKSAKPHIWYTDNHCFALAIQALIAMKKYTNIIPRPSLYHIDLKQLCNTPGLSRLLCMLVYTGNPDCMHVIPFLRTKTFMPSDTADIVVSGHWMSLYKYNLAADNIAMIGKQFELANIINPNCADRFINATIFWILRGNYVQIVLDDFFVEYGLTIRHLVMICHVVSSETLSHVHSKMRYKYDKSVTSSMINTLLQRLDTSERLALLKLVKIPLYDIFVHCPFIDLKEMLRAYSPTQEQLDAVRDYALIHNPEAYGKYVMLYAYNTNADLHAQTLLSLV